MKTISVVIPAYNAAAFLRETINSVLNQTVKAHEIIVVDDGSTDNTASIAESYPQVKCIRQPNSGGPGGPRNTALRYVTGDYIAFVDADDISMPDRFKWQAEFLDAHPNVGAVFTNYLNFSISGHATTSLFGTCAKLQRITYGYSSALNSEEACALLLQENFTAGNSMMIRKEVLNTVPGFFSELRACQDFHFVYLVARKWDIGVVNSVGVLRRWHESNVSSRPKTLYYKLLSRRLLRVTEQNPANLKLLHEFEAAVELCLARQHADLGEYSSSLGYIALALRHPLNIKSLAAAARQTLRTFAIASRLKPLSLTTTQSTSISRSVSASAVGKIYA